ncbi:hypothetical protein CRYUN_Cryun05aG0065600 [Craigia yunnanensis]
MGSTSIRFFFIVSFFFFALSSISFAQESKLEVEKEESDGAIKDLGRRGMIVSKNFQNGALEEKADVFSMGINLGFDSAGLGIFDAFFTSFSMIIISVIGDETFIIAALMAMRHPKSIVLSGALTALIIMTVLSTGLVLYAFFGLRLLYVAWRSDSKASQKKEMEEVEEKLETGQGKTSFLRFFSRFCTPIFFELATHKNAVGVAVGATLGHTICTSLAVVGGSMLAAKISQSTVATIGGLLFLGFSLSSYFYPPL